MMIVIFQAPPQKPPMDRPLTRKEISHQRIVDAAARALRRTGYAGTGVADIMKEAGLTHGGFYAHFESRDALLAEAISKAGRDNAHWFEQHAATRANSGASALRVTSRERPIMLARPATVPMPTPKPWSQPFSRSLALICSRMKIS